MHEIKLHELKKQRSLSPLSSKHSSRESLVSNENKLDMTILKLIPKFNEKDVTNFFMSFEKLMRRMACPSETWTLYLQSVLCGEAMSVYGCLSEEESEDYDTVKETVLSAYRLIPEAYRTKFRNLKKDDKSTYVEYVRTKERMLQEWLNSMEVEDFESFRNLIILEDFKNNVSPEIKLYIEDRREDTFAGAARLADEYCLTHSMNESKRKTDLSKGQKGKYSYGSNSGSKGDFRCYSCGKSGHTSKYCRNGNSNSSNGNSNSSSNVNSKEIFCFKCNGKGHISKNCTKGSNEKKSVALISKFSVGSKELTKGVVDAYGEYLYKGVVSSLEGGDSREVILLRDQGATVSVVRRESLPRKVKVSTREQVMLSGFPNTCVTCPLIELDIQSKLVSGRMKVAVSDSLPVDGVDMIVGNDVGSMPCNNPILCEIPLPELVITRSGVDTNEDYDFSLFEDSNVSSVDSDDGRGGSEKVLGGGMHENAGPLHVGNVCSGSGSSLKDGVTVAEIVCSGSPTSDLNDDSKGENSVILDDWNKDRIAELQRNDESLNQAFECETTEPLSDVSKETFALNNGILCRYVRPCTASRKEITEQLVVPRDLREVILKLGHDEGGHLGVDKTFKKICKSYFWPKMKRDVKRYVLTCH